MPSSPSAQADPARRPDWLTATPYAHRGLHGAGRLENSRAAFRAAIRAGFGIELDVQLSRDGHAIVFHDYELDRLTGESGCVAERSLAELQRVKLKRQDETISSLPQILDLIAARVPLLIEMKAPHRKVTPLCRAVSQALDGYSGHAAVMSFNPEVGGWFARHAPQVARGLVVTEEGRRGMRGRLQRRLALWRAQADFLAYDVRDLPSRFAAAERARGLPVLTWTLRNRRDEEIASAYADQIIHELPSVR